MNENEQNVQGTEIEESGITFKEILELIAKNIVLISIILAISIACGLGFALTEKPTYTATQVLKVSSLTYDNNENASNSSNIYNNYVLARNLMADIVGVCAQSEDIRAKANQNLEEANIANAEVYLNQIEISFEEESTIITVTYTDMTKEGAKAKLEAYVGACQNVLNDADNDFFPGGAKITPVSAILDPTANSTKVQKVLIAVAIGVVIAVLAVMLKHVLDDTISTPEELEKITGVKMYASISSIAVEKVRKKKNDKVENVKE